MTRYPELYWSVRREIWENRSVYLAPLFVAAVFLFGFLLSTITLPRRLNAASATPAQQHATIAMPFNIAAAVVLMAAFFVAIFYCLDALHGERRDRSILFWKSLPVSDRTTILSKAAIPFFVLPLVSLIIIIATQFMILAVSTIVLMGHDEALMALWRNVKFIELSLSLTYGIVAIVLWQAPIYAWLLLISGWVRHGAILWAVLPLLVLGAIEKMAFNTNHILLMMGFRMTGWYHRALFFPPKGSGIVLSPFQHLTPIRFLTTPGLWLGLIFAAACLAAAVRLRRDRGPL
jgi:ABC-2 type transport system permease protein